MSQAAKKQVAKATIEAEGARRLYSDVTSQYVRNGQGMMSQQYFAELMAKRATA